LAVVCIDIICLTVCKANTNNKDNNCV